MINALLLSLLCQDPDIAVDARGHRREGAFELTVTGKGRGLEDQEIVTLRFRRFENRVNWADGAITTLPVDEEAVRTAVVENRTFTHIETFPTPGEAELRLGLGRPEDGVPDDRAILRIVRVSSLPEEAHAIESDAKAFAAVLVRIRGLLEDLDALKRDPAPAMRRQGRLQKRIEWRRKACRQDLDHCFLSASARTLRLWMDDVDNAVALERDGKDAATMISLVSGKPFSWTEARSQFTEIEGLSLRERALLIVREMQEVGRDIAAAVRVGNEAHWARLSKGFERVLDALQDLDLASRSGPEGARYAASVDLEDSRVGDLAAQARQVLQAGAECVRCTPAPGDDFEDLCRNLRDRAAAFEIRIRRSR